MTKKLVLSTPPTLTKTNILFVAFLEGFLIMGVELIGAKITAPYYGTS